MSVCLVPTRGIPIFSRGIPLEGQNLAIAFRWAEGRRQPINLFGRTQLCFAVDGDTRSWGEMAVARAKARAKTKIVT